MTAWALPALAGAAYYLLAMAAAMRWGKAPLRRAALKFGDSAGCPKGRLCTALTARTVPEFDAPPISILKPVHGRDPRFYEAIRSHAEQDYPEFEILFGVTSAEDPAIEDIARLRAEFPGRAISLDVVATNAPNAKAGVLAGLSRRARYPVLLINDSDIQVPSGYLRSVAATLAEPGTGLATCLYRAAADSGPARWEALGIATEFAPSLLVARLLGVAEFALGSTMALRAETLAGIGGFEAIADYLADDYQLGRLVHQSGRQIRFAPVVVETHLGDGTWREVWRHQVRWSRTIRVSRPSGYYGYVVTHATFWAVVACCAGEWGAGALALGLRMAAGIWIGAGILGDREAARGWWKIPPRDLLGFAIWVAGLVGNTVDWRGHTLRLRADGRIRPHPRLQRPRA